jgi:hypothetical protein
MVFDHLDHLDHLLPVLCELPLWSVQTLILCRLDSLPPLNPSLLGHLGKIAVKERQSVWSGSHVSGSPGSTAGLSLQALHLAAVQVH